MLNSRSSLQMNYDSAIWYTEGLLNYEFANNTHMITEEEFFEFSYSIPANSYIIELSDLQTLYSVITDSILATVPVDKIVDGVDIEMDYELSNQSTIVVDIAFSYGYEIYEMRYIYPYVGSADYWWATWSDGKCGAYSGQGVGQDAGDKLEYSFNHPTGRTNYNYYYTDVIYALIHPSDVEESNNWGVYMMWDYVGGNDNDCLSPDEINYYISKFLYIRDLFCPSGKQYINVDVLNDMEMVQLGEPHHYFHTYQIYYGVPHLDPPIN